MAKRPVAQSVDEYIAQFPPQARAALTELRALVRESAPTAVEGISYAIAAYQLNGKPLIYFGGFKSHVGLYPVLDVGDEVAEELKPYLKGRGTARFPLAKPLPADLIRRLIRLRVQAVGGKPLRDVEKGLARAEFVSRLRRLADAVEKGQPFEIRIAGERIYIPVRAVYSIEHERSEEEEEIEFQIKWTRE